MKSKHSKDFYSTLFEACTAVKRLNITSQTEYKTRYQENPRLPSNPSRIYKAQWQGWHHFLDKVKPLFYNTLEEASLAAKQLNIKSLSEYTARYKENSFLPADPSRVYRAEWQSWYAFLGKDVLLKYDTLAEASAAAIRLNIKSSVEYNVRYKEDSRLPAKPYLCYSTDWQNWYNFFCKAKPSPYSTIAEASAAAQQLNIKSVAEYQSRYKENLSLPAAPPSVYVTEWKNWSHFLCHPMLYTTLAEASTAAIQLNIKSCADYKARYKEDCRLPAKPSKRYPIEWQSWNHFLGIRKLLFYDTLAEASAAAQQLNIKSWAQYKARYKENLRLPAHPDEVYATEWLSLHHFLGENKSLPYSTLAESSVAAQQLNMKTSAQYKARYKEDLRLPANPNQFYITEWQGWHHFLGKTKPGLYSTIAEASAAAKQLKIKTCTEYNLSYKEDPRLPADPSRVYVAQWKNWPHFLDKNLFYSKFSDARIAVQQLNIKSHNEYKARYRENSCLPAAPYQVYSAEWQGWLDFLGPKKNNFYGSITEAAVATQKLRIHSYTEYLKKYKSDSRLPSAPDVHFSQD